MKKLITPLLFQIICTRSLLAVKLCKDNRRKYKLPQEGPISTFPTQLLHILSTISGLNVWEKYMNNYETPIALRFAHLIDMMDWNCAAMYSSTWKDALTKQDPFFHTPYDIDIEVPVSDNNCGNGSTNTTESINLHSSDTRLLCIVNAWATVVGDWIPEATADMMEYVKNFMYTDVQAGWNSDVDKCFNLDNGTANVECLQDLAEKSFYSPSIVGSIVGRQINEYAKRDGWNMYGNLNSDGTKCLANCRRFTDPTAQLNMMNMSKKAIKKKHKKKNKMSNRNKWKPLLEDNSRGYFVRQEHVTPHIGLIGKTSVLTRGELDARNLGDPEYDYNLEARLVMQRMSELSPKDKMLIEFFDNKLKVGLTIAEAVVMAGTTFEQTLNFLVGYTAIEYDAVLLAWKEKVNHSLIRPTTWIQENLSDEVFMTWAGPTVGKREIQGKNFEAYIRVMPHSEYVSASACLCQTLYEFTDSWLNTHLGKENSIEIKLSFKKYSSIIEPNFSPPEDISVVFDNLLTFRDACGESRLNGGMHFTTSVPDGYQLCEGMGEIGNEYTKHLLGNFVNLN